MDYCANASKTKKIRTAAQPNAVGRKKKTKEDTIHTHLNRIQGNQKIKKSVHKRKK